MLYGIAQAALDDGVNLPILMVRDKRKDHNQKKWVEGPRQPADVLDEVPDGVRGAGRRAGQLAVADSRDQVSQPLRRGREIYHHLAHADYDAGGTANSPAGGPYRPARPPRAAWTG